MDSFRGCYKHTLRHHQHLATLYLAVRFLNLLLYSIFNKALYLPSASPLLVYTLALVAKFKLYKNKRSNAVDVVLLLIILPTSLHTYQCLHTIMVLSFLNGPMHRAACGIALSVATTHHYVISPSGICVTEDRRMY